MSGLDAFSEEFRRELEDYIDDRIATALQASLDGQRWLTVTATAEYLGISERAVRARIERGRIPAKRQGRSVVVDRIALDREIESA